MSMQLAPWASFCWTSCPYCCLKSLHQNCYLHSSHYCYLQHRALGFSFYLIACSCITRLFFVLHSFFLCHCSQNTMELVARWVITRTNGMYDLAVSQTFWIVLRNCSPLQCALSALAVHFFYISESIMTINCSASALYRWGLVDDRVTSYFQFIWWTKFGILWVTRLGAFLYYSCIVE